MKLLLSSFLSILILTFTVPTFAAEIAVVDVQRIMKEAKAAQSIKEQVKAKQKSFQGELDEKEKSLQREDQELAKQRTLISKEEFEKKYLDFRKKASDAQQEIHEKRARLDKAFGEALATVQKQIVDIVQRVAKDKGVEVAIARSQLIYAKEELDITEPVLTSLNKELPNITVKFE